MRTRSYHYSALGSFSPSQHADACGWVHIHDSARYASATDSQLHDWRESRMTAVRAAADTELAHRALTRWQESGSV